MLWLRPDTGVRCGVLRPCGVLFFFNIDGNGAVMSAYRLRFSLQWTAAAALAVASGVLGDRFDTGGGQSAASRILGTAVGKRTSTEMRH